MCSGEREGNRDPEPDQDIEEVGNRKIGLSKQAHFWEEKNGFISLWVWSSAHCKHSVVLV